nr:putative wd repeat-containing protein c3h5.08c [Quercus suber]
MAECIPAITLTDPHNQHAAPSPAQSPTRGTTSTSGTFEERVGDKSSVEYGNVGRSSAAKNGHSNRTGSISSNSAWPSPARLMRSLSNNGSSATTWVPPGDAKNDDAATSGKPESQTIDPLSKHIMARTHQPPQQVSAESNGSRPRSSEKPRTAEEQGYSQDPSPAPAVREPQSQGRAETPENTLKDLRKGVKAVSFLSKLMGGSKKKNAESEAGDEEEEESNEGRPEGNDAHVFAQPLDRMGFNPRHLQPPSYIKVRSKYKKARDFDRLFLAQELDGTKRPRLERQNTGNRLRRKTSVTPDADTIWAMEFSRDGRHLAAAGTDTVVRVWAVIASPEDREKHQKQESRESEINGVDDAHAEHLSAPVFLRKPVREYDGHKATVLDLSWSKNNFLLSSSMDKTVRLWHTTRAECLCTFQHSDFVPSISFHPKDDRFFLAGSLDSKLRLWSIPDKSVAYLVQVPDMITAVAFTPDGKYAVAGCLSGLCMFYETEGLKYQTQIHVRSTRGQNAKGSKITGIQAYHAASGDVKILITSNDSRVRLYNFRDKSLELKLRGNENSSSQIRATLSDDGRYVACGSEDRKAYLWSLGPAEGEKRDKRPVEMFEAHNTITTAVCFAPTKTRHLLSKSEDPVYDLCNPPPITLRSKAEQTESQSSSKAPTENGSVRHVSTDADAKYDKPLESPAYLTRSGHKEGNIIVTADYTGKIKVFRQDCSYSKRTRPDEWDRASLFAKRSAGKLSRNGSIATKASQRSLTLEGRASTSTAPSSERILSWRQNIASTPSITEKDTSTLRSSSKPASRSISPGKSLKRLSKPASPSAVPSPRDDGDTTRSASTGTQHAEHLSPKPAIDEDPLRLQGGQSYVFWDTDIWKTRFAVQRQQQHHVHENDKISDGNDTPGHAHLSPPDESAEQAYLRPGGLTQSLSYVSQLSDERRSNTSSRDGTATEEDEEFDDAREDLGRADDLTSTAWCSSTFDDFAGSDRQEPGPRTTTTQDEDGNIIIQSTESTIAQAETSHSIQAIEPERGGSSNTRYGEATVLHLGLCKIDDRKKALITKSCFNDITIDLLSVRKLTAVRTCMNALVSMDWFQSWLSGGYTLPQSGLMTVGAGEFVESGVRYLWSADSFIGRRTKTRPGDKRLFMRASAVTPLHWSADHLHWPYSARLAFDSRRLKCGCWPMHSLPGRPPVTNAVSVKPQCLFFYLEARTDHVDPKGNRPSGKYRLGRWALRFLLHWGTRVCTVAKVGRKLASDQKCCKQTSSQIVCAPVDRPGEAAANNGD